MHRHLGSLAALSLIALAVAGCPDDAKEGPGSSPSAKASAKPSSTPTATAKPTSTAAANTPSGPTGSIKATVELAGAAPEMKVPAAREKAEVCKDTKVKYNAVVSAGGKLQDALVRIVNGGVKGDWKPPAKHAEIDQKDCMYSPRIQGVVAGQDVDIKNGDATLHNVHTYKGTESLFNTPQPKGSDTITKNWDDGVIKFTCDVHPWMRGFVVVTDHPFFGTTGADGTTTIDKVPVGKYDVEVIHAHYGVKKGTVEVAEGKAAEVKFSYDGKESEPDWNKDELKGLW